MAWHISGKTTELCSCKLMCPCWLGPDNEPDQGWCAGAFGFDDIDFESAEFSKRFYVKSPDKRFAYDVVHPRMMEFLLDRKAPCVDIENARCCISDGSRRWSPQQFRSTLGWLDTFFERWPEHVLVDLQSRRA